jgi:hypothetical protein
MVGQLVHHFKCTLLVATEERQVLHQYRNGAIVRTSDAMVNEIAEAARHTLVVLEGRAAYVVPHGAATSAQLEEALLPLAVNIVDVMLRQPLPSLDGMDRTLSANCYTTALKLNELCRVS